MLIKNIVDIRYCIKTIQVKGIYVFVFRTPCIQTLIRRQSESMVNHTRIDIFLEYYTSSSNMTRCQVPSRVRAWFYDSAGDIDFYQMSLTQSDLAILHESII